MSSATSTNTYWDLGWVRYHYNQLGDKTSYENIVDHMWTAILYRQFPAVEDYNLFVRDRTIEQSEKSPDTTVKQLQNFNPFTILIMENKRADYAGQSAVWARAVEDLAEYLDLEMESSKPKFQVGLVAIGRYVRFYWQVKIKSLVDYPGTDGKAYEVRDDKEEVQRILLNIKAKTKQG
ncbi:MAG: hypothetical protein Q9163_004497 [Psora crenata]